VKEGGSRVSVLLPTYNRAAFLPAAFQAIAGQTFTDWDLVVVDDGSTDDTEAVVSRLRDQLPQRVTYVRQPNAGAYGARNRALDLATGSYVAFYDSDDLWLPHHLERCVAGLDVDATLDWVYAACSIVDHRTGRLLDSNTFVLNGAPRPFTTLRTRTQAHVRVFEDTRTVSCAISDGLYCGLQNSVIRRSVFETARFDATFRNEAEDQLFVIRTLKRGRRMGYIDAVHVQYHVHDSNSSAPDAGQSIERQLAVYLPLVRGFRQLRSELTWTPQEKRELSRRIAQDQFWHIGYVVLWQGGRREQAIEAYRAGLREWPWNLKSWKTYVAARLRLAFGRNTAKERTT
jgi:glycosyltransferase involved in cell wall biosynthesis